ncbi:MAG: BREX-1 system adenine-specific DNA-methyltransferase PglX [Candidatus Omnitrophota bacterium]
MNKKSIEKFAINARLQLLEQVSQRAAFYGVCKAKIYEIEQESSDGAVIQGKVHSKAIKEQRHRLIERIQSQGFDAAMEEIAYTWFNRFIALRFMEVNDYLGLRAFSSRDHEKRQPDLLTHALEADLPIDKNEVYRLQQAHKDEELYKLLLIAQCNALHRQLPFLFERVADYSELLFPSNLLFTGSAAQRLVEEIPEEDWREVEIIGWLYQYYISEKKDEAIKAKKKYRNDQIPVVTQLFTPKWLVQYMVDNSLGRAWLEAHPSSQLAAKMEYYIPPREDASAKKILQGVKPEEIAFFDPACGSGHILVYAFDLLYEIYLEQGYDKREIPQLILEKNLFGLDIDERAIQLACFALMMKARSKSRRILEENIHLNVLAFADSQGIETFEVAYTQLIGDFRYGKVYGSLIQPQQNYAGSLLDQPEFVTGADDMFTDYSKPRLDYLMKLSELLKKKYHFAVTNPPYIGGKYMNDLLGDFLKKNYPNTKSDMFAAFTERAFSFVKEGGYIGLVTPFVWMFIQSYEWLRKHIVEHSSIISLVKPEYHFFFDSAFVPLVSFILKKSKDDLQGEFFDLSHVRSYDEHIAAFNEAIQNPAVKYRYSARTSDFQKIPGSPIAYWVSDKVREIFQNSQKIGDVAEPRQGLATADNDRFLRLWFEVCINNIGFGFGSREKAKVSGLKWFPLNKGGDYRRWYGNNEFVVNWKNDGDELCKFKPKAVIRNTKYYFQEGLTWSEITVSLFHIRLSNKGFIFDTVGQSIFTKKIDLYLILSYMNSKVFQKFIHLLSPTMHFGNGSVSKVPIIEIEEKEFIIEITKNNVNYSQTDWDSFETSWDFAAHPFLKHKEDGSMQKAYENWASFAEKQFQQLKANEEELNRIFIDIYGLQDELTPDVPDEEITIRKANRERDVKSFLSYAVGCMLGRYSLGQEGLAYAGGEFDPGKYKTFPADMDNIIPILDADYFEDDIVGRFAKFLKAAFGSESFHENLQFIAAALGQKNNETPMECVRRYFVNQFYKDHVQTYKKRPIYWLFTSGKLKAFNALVYMHRYDASTLSRMRTDYLHELQGKIEIRLQQLEGTANGGQENAKSPREKQAAQKEIARLRKQQEEMRQYDEKLRHHADRRIEIDLDDGVAVNYAKFEELTAKI